MPVSIVIPTYNRPHFLSRLLESIAAQTFRDFEVIVINDSPKEIPQYKEVLEAQDFTTFTYFYNEGNKGSGFSRNRGIEAAQYDFIALVDDDDVWAPTKLEKQVAVFSESDDPKLGIVYTWAHILDGDANVIGRSKPEYEGDVIKRILQGNFMPLSSVLTKKSVLVEAGLFDQSFPCLQDWDMWTRIFAKGYTCKLVRSVETYIYLHSEGRIGASPFAALGHVKFHRKHEALFQKYLPKE